MEICSLNWSEFILGDETQLLKMKWHLVPCLQLNGTWMLSLEKSSVGFFSFFIGHETGSAYLELGKWHRFNIRPQFVISIYVGTVFHCFFRAGSDCPVS